MALGCIPYKIAQDPWARDIFTATGKVFDEQVSRILAIYNFNNFRELTIEQIEYFERLLSLKSDDGKTLEERRSIIEVAWKSKEKPSIQNIQNICNSWKDGEAVVEYYAPYAYIAEDDSVEYGFVLKDDGYYESTNNGIKNSFSYCKIIFNCFGLYNLKVTYVNYAEAKYDCGILSQINKDLTKTYNADAANYALKLSSSGDSSPDEKNYEYTAIANENYITVKYRKDSSNDKYNDSFKFKIDFTDNLEKPKNTIILTFVSEYGTPTDLDALIKAVRFAVPAHLPIFYKFKYLLIRDIHEAMTISEIETKKLDVFAR